MFLFRQKGSRLARAGLPVLLLAISITGARAEDHRAQRSFSRSYSVTRECTLEVQNKYGKIEVRTWDKDSVSIDVDIHLTESSASKLRKLKEDVSISFSQTADYILASSQFKSESGRIASELKSVGHTISGSNKHVEINYALYIPAYLDIVLVNKFGDIYLDNHRGHLDVDLSNGVLKAGELTGVSKISLSFANGMVQSLGSSTMQLSYSDLSLGDAGQLDLNSKSSKLKADSVNVLKINSRRDKLHFQRVEYLYGDGSFSEVWIYDFLRESDLYMRYGKLTIEHVMPDFNKIYIESDYTDISLYFDRASTFAYDIMRHDKAVLRLPEGVKKSGETLEGKEHFRSSGIYGKDGKAGQLTIDALQKCYINLSIK